MKSWIVCLTVLLAAVFVSDAGIIVSPAPGPSKLYVDGVVAGVRALADDVGSGVLVVSGRVDNVEAGILAASSRVDNVESGVVAVSGRVDDVEGLTGSWARVDGPNTFAVTQTFSTAKTESLIMPSVLSSVGASPYLRLWPDDVNTPSLDIAGLYAEAGEENGEPYYQLGSYYIYYDDVNASWNLGAVLGAAYPDCVYVNSMGDTPIGDYQQAAEETGHYLLMTNDMGVSVSPDTGSTALSGVFTNRGAQTYAPGGLLLKFCIDISGQVYALEFDEMLEGWMIKEEPDLFGGYYGQDVPSTDPSGTYTADGVVFSGSVTVGAIEPQESEQISTNWIEAFMATSSIPLVLWYVPEAGTNIWIVPETWRDFYATELVSGPAWVGANTGSVIWWPSDDPAYGPSSNLGSVLIDADAKYTTDVSTLVPKGSRVGLIMESTAGTNLLFNLKGVMR